MGSKRNRGHTRGQGNSKRRKLNLYTVKQKNDFRQYGESHPVDTKTAKVKETKYTEVEDEEDEPVADTSEESSSSENEEEVPIMQQLLSEIGVKEEEPESEQESEDDDDDENGGAVGGDDSEQESDQDEDDVDSEEENVLQDASSDDEEEDSISPDAKRSENSESDEEVDEDENEPLNEEVVENGEDGSEADESDGEEADESDGEEAEEIDEEDEAVSSKEEDPFTVHFDSDRDVSDIVEQNVKWQQRQLKMPSLGDCTLMFKDPSCLPEISKHSDLRKLHVRQQLCNQLSKTATKLCRVELQPDESMTTFQHKLFCALNSYQDLLYPKQTIENMDEIRMVYCLHALNHVLKSRNRVVTHNAKLKRPERHDEDLEYRDQGLTRPKVLIVLPYRGRALKVVNFFISLLSTEQVKVSNQKRFGTEYSELEGKEMKGKRYKSVDYFKRFEGNVDDNFRIGMSVAKKNLRLYSPFYESDIILASPLGLRTVIGEEGDQERDFDFLSSVEVLIMDEADVFMMQNWDHVTHLMKHLHLQPKESHGVDFSRVRMWSVDGMSKHFRQSIILSSIQLPEFQNIFNKRCHNYTGKVLIHKKIKTGTINSTMPEAPQIFHRIPCESPDGISQRKAKLDYLIKKIIPYHTSAGMTRTLIYCNYFSFVMLRNYFRKEEIRFLFINEYDAEKHMRKTRRKFRKLSPHFLLYTDRLHFHYRFRLRGVYHLVWFDLPQYPVFYPELVNLLETTKQACSSTCLFTKFDCQRLMEIVGQNRAAHMINSSKSINMIAVT